MSATVNSEAAPAAASTLHLGTIEVLSKSVPNAVQQDQLIVPMNTVLAPLHTGSPPAANNVPTGLQASQVLLKNALAAESLPGSDSKAASGATPPASTRHAQITAAPCARGERVASAAVDQNAQQSNGLSRASADKAAQQHTAGLRWQHVPSRNATAADSTAVATPAQAAIPGASAGSSPADVPGPALMPRSGLGAAPTQTGNASLSASTSPTARSHSKAVTAGAQCDMYAVSDALLLDNISAAAAASQGSAGSKQSGGASQQTKAASSSSTTPASKGTQVGPLLGDNPPRTFILGLPGSEMWLQSKRSGKKS